MFSSSDMLLGRRLSEDSSSGGGWSLVLFSGFALVALPWAFLWGLLLVLTKYPKIFLQATLLAPSGALLAGTIITLVTALDVITVILGVALIISIVVYFHVRGRIQFVGEHLKVSALVTTSMPLTVLSALLMSAFQVLWATVVSLAASGTAYALETVRAPGGTDVYRAVDCHNEMIQGATSVSCVCSGEIIDDSACSYSDPNKFLVFFWLATLIWSGEVGRNVVAATVTGSVASWWYTPHDPSPVKGAFYRATGPSFGSLCKASAVTGAVRFIRWITCRSYRCSRLIGSDYAVGYTACFISIYGLSFSEAGSRVRELFLSCGVTTIANDTAVDLVFSLLTVACVMVYLMAFLLFVTSDSASNLASENIGGLIFVIFICRIVVSTTLQVVRSGFKAVFVCFVQDPDVLATNHDQQLHADLSRAWQSIQLNERPPRPGTFVMEVELASQSYSGATGGRNRTVV